MKKIAYQGKLGSFSHITASRIWHDTDELRGFETFSEVFAAVENGEADFALIPVENTIMGEILENLDHLKDSNLNILFETTTRIQNSLLAPEGAEWKGLKRVLSHPAALAQCTYFLRSRHLQASPHWDTAGAASHVAESNDSSLAAIACADAAEVYGLKVLNRNIQDNQENHTRFFVLGKEASEKGNKTSLVFSLEHRKGALAEILSIFSRLNLNLMKIASRPILGKPFEYLFYVDIEGKIPDDAVEELKSKTKTLKCLGVYHVL